MSTEPRILAGRYRVDEQIGKGGMAQVFRGYDVTLGRPVAIKVLDSSLAADRAFRTRFRLEAQAASRMSHPSIVRVFDAGEDTDPATGAPVPFIVMELIEGTLLKDIMSAGPVPTPDAVKYVDGILEALDYSHRAGVVHRDIKPGNVMVTPNGAVKVMDFGIARAVSDSSSTVAETTRIIGTAAYLSPEQAKGEAVDARTDLYSAGVVLYELLAGRQPFRGDSPVAVAYQHVSETPLAPTEVNEAAPGALNPVVLRALAKDPFQRYPDAASFRVALRDAVGGKTPSKRTMNTLTNELYGQNPRQAEETARSLRQLSTDTTMTRTQSGPPVVWIWVGVALLAILIGSVLFWALSVQPRDGVNTGSRTVPVLTGMTFEAAEQELEALDLVALLVQESSTEIAEGFVIRTTPEAGITVMPGQTITVYVSSGAETTEVPELIGLSDTAARDALDRAGLKLGTITPRNDTNAAAGTVLEASEEAGAEVEPGTVVNLVVASGNVTLNDVSGWTLDAAIPNLEGLGLEPTPVAQESCPATDPHTVASMSVAPGDVPIHSRVDLYYCTGE